MTGYIVPMRTEKKVWTKYFKAIIDGKKNYELRLADWECSVAHPHTECRGLVDITALSIAEAGVDN